jgi:hypothetical protein
MRFRPIQKKSLLVESIHPLYRRMDHGFPSKYCIFFLHCCQLYSNSESYNLKVGFHVGFTELVSSRWHGTCIYKCLKTTKRRFLIICQRFLPNFSLPSQSSSVLCQSRIGKMHIFENIL